MNRKLGSTVALATLLFGLSATFGQTSQVDNPCRQCAGSQPLENRAVERVTTRALDDAEAVRVQTIAARSTRPRGCNRCYNGCPSCRPRAAMPYAPQPSVEQAPGAATGQPSQAESGMRPAQPSTEPLAGNIGLARAPEAVGPFMMGDFITGGAFGGNVMLNCSLREPYGNDHLGAPFSFHTFKIADNESPWPRNRVFLTSEYFRQVGDTTAVTQETLGFERTFQQNRSSFGMRLPFYTVDPGAISNPLEPGQIGTFGLGTSTRGDLGDLTLIGKHAVVFDPANGNVLSLGAALITPTGPSTLASVTPAYTVNGVGHYGSIQPYLGFYRSIGPAFNGLFVQGFSSIDRPFSGHDSTFWFNDIGLGYYYQRNVRRGLTGVVPNVEVHVNTPLGGRVQTITSTPALAQLTGFTSVMGQIQYYNQVNLTSGVTFVFNRRTTLALATVAPLATPHPFNVEFLAQINVLRAPWLPAPPP
jgi:hypothetical protein